MKLAMVVTKITGNEENDRRGRRNIAAMRRTKG